MSLVAAISAEQAVVVAAAISAVLGGAAASSLVHAWSQRKVTEEQVDSLAVETADRMLIRQQDQIDRGDVERERLVVELAALRAELVALRKELKVERALRAESDSNFRQEIERLAAIISGGS